MDQYDKLMTAHLDEIQKAGAEIYNLGWATGDDFVHSKTSAGRLFTQENPDGTYYHEWDTSTGNYTFKTELTDEQRDAMRGNY